ncbi:hypothetical protein A0J61_03835 [Choanephora cucurbitarum]|uniref:Uncharacterized protein n=1 Tax=Choanephora cucurbitarum TaxID=101091 RepID=A0A1C7NG62_9FUNG|nr:hypothetical protein A0J61_03835 [Choanephora cucurbitarum]
MNQQQLKQLMKFFEAKFDALDKRMDRLERAQKCSTADDNKESNIVPAPYYFDKERGKLKKQTITTKLIKKTIGEIGFDRQIETFYKTIRRACYNQASDMVHNVYLNKPVKWSLVDENIRSNAINKATKNVYRSIGYDFHQFEDDWAIHHLIRRAYANKYAYYLKMVEAGTNKDKIQELMRYLAKEDLIEIEDDDDDSQIEHGSSEVSKITKESKTMSVAGKRKAESLSDS